MLVERVWTPAGRVPRWAATATTPDGPRSSADGDPEPGDADRCRSTAWPGSRSACNDASLRAPDDAGGDVDDHRRPDRGRAPRASPASAASAPRDLARRATRASRSSPSTPPRRRMTTLHADGGRVWVAVEGRARGARRRSLDPADAPTPAPTPRRPPRALRRRRLPRPRPRRARRARRVPEPLERRRGEPAARSGSWRWPIRPAPSVGGGDRGLPRGGHHAGHDHRRPPAAPRAAIARRLGHPRDRRRRGRSPAPSSTTLDDAAFATRRRRDVAVYARTNPEQKLRIVEAWQARGAVVAMTGDGVNDAPALAPRRHRRRHGHHGTEVSKEAADMVLADDDFATIVAAVEEGRRIYDNIRRFVRYLLTTNSAEVWVMFLAPVPRPAAPAPGRPDPVDQPRHRRPAGPRPRRRAGRARHDAPAARARRRVDPRRAGSGSTALWVGPAHGGRRPRRPGPRDRGATGPGRRWSSRRSPSSSSATPSRCAPSGVSVLPPRAGDEPAARARRRRRRSLVQLALIYVPVLQPIFVTEALGGPELLIVLVASSVGWLGVEIEKAIGSRLGRGPTAVQPA